MTETIALELDLGLLVQVDRAVRRRQAAIRNEPATRATIIRAALREHFDREHDARRGSRAHNVAPHPTYYRACEE